MDHIERAGLRPARMETGRTGGYLSEVAAQLAGWPTATTHDDHLPGRGCMESGGRQSNLLAVAQLATAVHGCASSTPANATKMETAQCAELTTVIVHAQDQPKKMSLSTGTAPTVLRLDGYCTPSARDHKDTPGMETEGVNPDGSTRNRMDQLPRQVSGAISASSHSETEKRGALNAAHSRWLMGYTVEWCMAAISAHRMLKQQRKRG
jgi:hypothetical protein